MSNFKYQAIDIDKKIVEGSIEANSLREARLKICEMGLLPTDISFADYSPINSEYKSDLKKLSSLSDKPLKLSSKLLFVSEMQTMLASSISILDALNVLNRPSLEDKNLRMLVDHVQSSIIDGSTFTQALKPFTESLGTVIIGLISAGEASGKLVLTLDRAKTLLKKEQKIRSYIIRVSIYPCVMIFLAFLFLCVICFFVVPRLQALPSTGDIPSLAKDVLFLPRFIMDHFWVIFIAVFGFFGFCFSFFSSKAVKRKIDEILLNIPKLSDFVRYINLSNYFAVLAETYDSDVPIAEAFEYSAKSMGNSVMRENALELVDLATRGVSITDSLVEFDYLDPNFITSIAAGEKSGELTQKFAEISVVIDEHIDATVDVLLSLLGPLTIIIVGILIALIAVAFYQTYFGILMGL